MADEIPMIPKAGSLLINSGNIVNWNRLKRKPSQTPTDEISECVSSTLQSFLSSADKNELQYVTDLSCVHEKYKETIPKDDRGDLKLTVKIFICSLQHVSPDSIKEAVEKALGELDVAFIETALIAFPEIENEDITLEIIQPFWKVLEGLVHRELVWAIGIADLDKNLLEELYEWAEVKPVINQVNLDSCCVMPKDLVEYAKLNDIQLLTHNDPRTVFSSETLQGVIRENSTEKDSENWDALWVLRYSVLVKCRGIVKAKGYLLKATRDIKKRK
ncbi:glutamate--cysteine ligase regulatory subunit-like [Ruditapes philippinarum]|uniref:glutamate--cysteine ligase regulatory subunit-like n=1 Tax=Ruditapes philippinarum TaxID=129788 RepID=UPI00295C305D|nr:glutamate--cysteine ligase regulatory subunit-like [Ruditapes philippinarum]